MFFFPSFLPSSVHSIIHSSSFFVTFFIPGLLNHSISSKRLSFHFPLALFHFLYIIPPIISSPNHHSFYHASLPSFLPSIYASFLHSFNQYTTHLSFLSFPPAIFLSFFLYIFVRDHPAPPPLPPSLPLPCPASNLSHYK